jgi:hypothetical protein
MMRKGQSMPPKISAGKIKKGLVIGSVPVGIPISTLLPLRPVIQQALVGLTLVWLYIGLILLER